MPFKSLKQQKFMWARRPEIAKRWTEKYGPYHGGKIGDCPQCKVGELLSATDPNTGETYIYCKKCGFSEQAEQFNDGVSENIFMQRMFSERPELKRRMGGKYTIVRRHGRKTKKKRTNVKRHVRKLKRYAVRVYFWNIDEEYGWKRDYVLRMKPTKQWLDSLYDGVNKPTNYKMLGRVV